MWRCRLGGLAWGQPDQAPGRMRHGRHYAFLPALFAECECGVRLPCRGLKLVRCRVCWSPLDWCSRPVRVLSPAWAWGLQVAPRLKPACRPVLLEGACGCVHVTRWSLTKWTYACSPQFSEFTRAPFFLSRFIPSPGPTPGPCTIIWQFGHCLSHVYM